MSADRIHLPIKAKKYVLKLCKRIQEKAPNNKKAIEMSTNFANTARKYGTLSSNQIVWLINNARIHKIKLLPELAELVSKGRDNPKTIRANTSNYKSEDFESNVIRRISRLEKHVKELRSAL